MEHGWCPTNFPGRTPIQTAGRFAVLLDFPGFLILNQPPECMEHGSSPTNYPIRTPIQIVGRLLFSVIILAAGRTRTGNQIVKESSSSPTSPARRTYSSLTSVSAETTFYGLAISAFLSPENSISWKQRSRIAETPG